MPICPRCGKCLSSDQALTYHLNRKYRCGTWKCTKCNQIFNTKFQLQMHEMECLNEDIHDKPSVDFLLKLYNNLPFVIVNIENDVVTNVSENCTKILGMTRNYIKNNMSSVLHNISHEKTEICTDNDKKIILIKKCII